ncbi:MAG: hypothetical protein H7Y11_15975 [Armatimonadetes bacterium]|nr:hypothetical protein [Anaerolineae bacterium]
MNLLDILRILARRGWIIVLLALFAAGSAYLLTREQTPVYRSTQLVLIQPSRADLGLSVAIVNLLNSYALYLNSSLRAQEIIDQLQLDTTAGELQSRVAVKADTLQLSIQIDVEDSSEAQANRIATGYGLLLKAYRDNINQTQRREDRIDAVIQDIAKASLARPRLTINAAAGGVLGLLVGGVIVFILELIESSVVRRREDLERALNLPVLATAATDAER